MPTRTLGQWLEAEPFTLAMSSGFFGFFAHAGMLRALEEAGFAPARVAGSSAGALVTGMWAAGLSARSICDELLAVERRAFWDPRPGLGILRGDKFRMRLADIIGAVTFEQCRAPASLSVFAIRRLRTEVIRDGDLASAIVSSCAFPGLFQPIRRNGELYSDGGILDRPGLAGVERGERTLHHHLTSRSPWRRRNSSALVPPQRVGLVSLTLGDLPRANPFNLEAGHRAMELAYERARRAVDSPV